MEYSNRKERRLMLKNTKRNTIRNSFKSASINIRRGKELKKIKDESVNYAINEYKEVLIGELMNKLRNEGYTENQIQDIIKARNILSQNKDKRSKKIARELLKKVRNDKNNIKDS